MKLNLKILTNLAFAFAFAHCAIAMDNPVVDVVKHQVDVLETAMKDTGVIIEWGADQINASSLQDKEIVEHVIDSLKAINQGLDICVQHAKVLRDVTANARNQVTDQLAEQQDKSNASFARNLQLLYKAMDKLFALRQITDDYRLLEVLSEAKPNIPYFSEMIAELQLIAHKVCFMFRVTDYFFNSTETGFKKYSVYNGRFEKLGVGCNTSKGFVWDQPVTLFDQFREFLEKMARLLEIYVKAGILDANGNSLEPVANAMRDQLKRIDEKLDEVKRYWDKQKMLLY